MRVNIAQTTPPLSPPPSPHNTTPSSLFPSPKHHLHRSPSCTLTSKSTAHNLLRRSCSASFDGHDFPHHTPFEDFNKKNNTPHKLNFSNSRRFSTSTTTTSFKHSDTQVDVLEPSLLGIRPEPPDWPARDAMIRECIARRASSIELPLSLRMIKMKQKLFRENVDLEQHMKKDCDPLNCLCCSTLFIVREIQSNALKRKGMVFNEVLDDGILSKVQSELSCSFIWLFREVFAKTPDLMLQIMVLTSGFATFSLDNLQSLEKDQHTIDGENQELSRISKNWGVGDLELGKSGVPTREVLDNMVESEVGLWNSIVDEANKLVKNGGFGGVKDQGLGFIVDNDDHDVIDDDDDMLREKKKTEFVSPVGVEIEKDDYEEYYRTDLLYQMGLFQDSNNTLLLSNYAQFLCLVSRDYDRAEECFKRAIQLDPTDAEVMTQYANFLWVVKNDLWGAEEKFQQAMAAEPNNSYHASKYASFLWSTGGEDTCYPIDSARG